MLTQPIAHCHFIDHFLPSFPFDSASVFEVLGFATGPGARDGKDDGLSLHPPDIDPSTIEGKRTRARLLRAWVEISSWTSTYYKARDRKPRILFSHLLFDF